MKNILFLMRFIFVCLVASLILPPHLWGVDYGRIFGCGYRRFMPNFRITKLELPYEPQLIEPQFIKLFPHAEHITYVFGKKPFCNSHIDRLSLDQQKHLTNLRFLEGFHNLQSLNLRCCRQLGEHCNPIKDLTSLQWLNMRLTGVKDTSFLRGLKKIQHLQLSYTSIETVRDVVPLPELTHLELEGCTLIKDIDRLSEATQLVSLNLGGMLIEDGDPVPWHSLDFLESLVNLEHLDLSSYQLVMNLEPLIKLQKLRYLNLGGCEGVKDYSLLAEIKTLEELCILSMSTHFAPPHTLDFAKKLPRLKRIHIINPYVGLNNGVEVVTNNLKGVARH